MIRQQKQLSQAEIWDDSALVKSWDDALQEYKVCLQGIPPKTTSNVRKLYHSIHARGERVEDVMKEIQEKNETSGKVLAVNMGDSVSMTASRHDNGNVSNELEDGEFEENSGVENTCTNKVRLESHLFLRLVVDFLWK